MDTRIRQLEGLDDTRERGASAPEDVDDPNAVITGGGSLRCKLLGHRIQGTIRLEHRKGYWGHVWYVCWIFFVSAIARST